MGSKAQVVAGTRERESPSSSVSLAAKPRWPRAPVILPAVTAGGIWWACHFPLNWGWLAWVALVPLLIVVRSQTRVWRVYFASWLCGLVFYWGAIQWMRYAADPKMVVTWGALATYCSLYVPLMVFLVRVLDARSGWPLIVTFPAVWTGLEYLRAHFATGFPWYFLAHTHHNALWLIQISDVTGAYGVSFIIAAVNVLAFELFLQWPRFRVIFALPERPLAALRIQAVVTLGFFTAVCLYGVYRLQQEAFETGPRLALVQPNIEQRIRNEASSPNADPEKIRKPMKQEYTELHELAVQGKPDLIVWPETSFWDEWWEPDATLRFDDLPPDFQKPLANGGAPPADAVWRPQLTAFLNKDPLEYFRKWPVPILFGMNSRIKMDIQKPGEGKHYNSAILLLKEGEPNWYTRYDKIHRVPFGEYVPLKDWIPLLNKLSPYETTDYSIISGDRFTRFPFGKYHFGALICFEDTDPCLARQYLKHGAEEGPPVDFLVNLSNDGWFDGSAANDEHLAIARFRAIECRRSLARSANMGISAIIDGNGRIVKMPSADWRSSKKLSAVVAASIPLDRRGSLYAMWGDWLPVACWLLVGAGIFLGPSLNRHRLGTISGNGV